MPEKRKRRSYTLEDRERGLAAMVLAGDSAARASRKLADAGFDVPDDTLTYWRGKFQERYAELRQHLRPKVEEEAAAQAEALILGYADIQQRLATRFDVNEVPHKDIPGALRNIATAQALQVDKVQGPLRGRPQIVEHRSSPDELLAKLTRALGSPTIDSTAVEIPNQALQRETRP